MIPSRLAATLGLVLAAASARPSVALGQGPTPQGQYHCYMCVSVQPDLGHRCWFTWTEPGQSECVEYFEAGRWECYLSGDTCGPDREELARAVAAGEVKSTDEIVVRFGGREVIPGLVLLTSCTDRTVTMVTEESGHNLVMMAVR